MNELIADFETFLDQQARSKCRVCQVEEKEVIQTLLEKGYNILQILRWLQSRGHKQLTETNLRNHAKSHLGN